MRRLGLLLLSALTFTSLSACQRDDTRVSDRLDRMEKKQDQILSMLRSGAGRGGRPAAARHRPSPTDVFAVPVAGSPTVGPKDAKVTIVEAFDFA